MSVLGVGVDVVHIPAFLEQLEDKASSFVSKTFTATEKAYCLSKAKHLQGMHFAARYAAKEAFIKAWSSMHYNAPPILKSVILTDIEVLRDPWGRPRLRLYGQILPHMENLQAHLSLSHDGPIATAFVTLCAQST